MFKVRYKQVLFFGNISQGQEYGRIKEAGKNCKHGRKEETAKCTFIFATLQERGT